MFDWSDEYRVGIHDIDEQHQKLFSLLRELDEAARLGKGRSVVEKVLTGVLAYTREHFVLEEGLMRTHTYPDYFAHKQMHDGLTGQARDLLERTRKSPLTVSFEVMKFLEAWIAHHISQADRKLGTYLLSQGVK